MSRIKTIKPNATSRVGKIPARLVAFGRRKLTTDYEAAGAAVAAFPALGAASILEPESALAAFGVFSLLVPPEFGEVCLLQ